MGEISKVEQIINLIDETLAEVTPLANSSLVQESKSASTLVRMCHKRMLAIQ